jgi:hypothetical protein
MDDNRRRTLALLGTAGVSALAGCNWSVETYTVTESDPETDTETETETDAETPPEGTDTETPPEGTDTGTQAE